MVVGVETSPGKRIRELRIERGLTQVQLAAVVQVGQTAISQWERSVTVPTLTHLARIAAALECELVELLCT